MTDKTAPPGQLRLEWMCVHRRWAEDHPCQRLLEVDHLTPDMGRGAATVTVDINAEVMFTTLQTAKWSTLSLVLPCCWTRNPSRSASTSSTTTTSSGSPRCLFARRYEEFSILGSHLTILSLSCSLAVHPNGQLLATGQVGKAPPIHVWDSTTLKTVSIMKGEHERGIATLDFGGPDGRVCRLPISIHESVISRVLKTTSCICATTDTCLYRRIMTAKSIGAV